MHRRRRTLLVLLAALLVVLCALFLAWRPAPPPVVPATLPMVPARGGVAPEVPAVAASEPTVEEEEGPPDPGPSADLDALLAEEFGRIHVSCFVGEMYDVLRGVDDGWVSVLVDDPVGWKPLAQEFGGPAEMIVRWSAPEGATSATCVLEQTAWAELVVTVLDEDGGPGAGAGVLGCGQLLETDEDGVARVQAMVTGEPCTLDVYRWDPATRVHSQAFVKVPALHEHEERHLTVQMQDYDLSDRPGARFEVDHDTLALDEVVYVDPIDPTPLSPAEARADAEAALADAILYLERLDQTVARLPEDDRWAGDDSLDRAEASVESARARLEALEDEPTP